MLRADLLRFAGLFGALFLLSLPITVARGSYDPALERMAICRDSWLDWQKNDPTRLSDFGEYFRSTFVRKESDPFFVPKSDMSIAGLRVLRVFPDSLGMGVGFSVFVAATFDRAKRDFARALGVPIKKCETSDGMKTCELEIGERRTFMLMAEDSPKNSSTLVGCYYYYEK